MTVAEDCDCSGGCDCVPVTALPTEMLFGNHLGGQAIFLRRVPNCIYFSIMFHTLLVMSAFLRAHSLFGRGQMDWIPTV